MNREKTTPKKAINSTKARKIEEKTKNGLKRTGQRPLPSEAIPLFSQKV
jgi:hypothetical protein